MSDLRAKLVKVGADAIHSYEDGPRTTRNLSAAALDAMLDCLAENADELFQRPRPISPKALIRFVDHLREDR